MLTLFRRLRPFRALILLVSVLAFGQSLANLWLPRLMADIVDQGIVRGDTARILSIGAEMLVIALLGTACAVASSFVSARVAIGFGRAVRAAVFERVSHFSVHQFDQFSTASLITRTTNDTTQVQQMLVALLNMVITAPMMAIGGVVLALSQDATLARVLIAVIPIMAVVFLTILQRALPLFSVMQQKVDRLNLVLAEGISGVRIVRAFDRGDVQHARFDAANASVTDTALSVNRLVALLMPSMFLMLNLTSIAIIWVGGARIDQGTMEVGVMVSSLQYSMQILFAVFMVTALFVMFPRAAASAARINEVLAVAPEIVGQETSQAQPSTALRAGVVFEDVSFQYPGAEEPALAGVSFTAAAGQTTAIVGGTGAGKSTLVGLIPRLFDPKHGRVLLDGVDIRSLSLTDLRGLVGLVPQKALLFTGTIADNIRYGRETASDEEVRHAARVAQAEDFVLAMPDGYQSSVSQGGTNLSGGQKQRLSIARAVVRRPAVYVFDDSFSALDVATDARVRAALRDETREATVIVVAQRITTAMAADRIVVLEAGAVVGIGTHQDLLASCGVYQEIVASQLTREEVA